MPSPSQNKPGKRILPAAHQADLRHVADYVRGPAVRSAGQRAHPAERVLFVGGDRACRESSAQTLAAELHCELYRVDLSAVVSKYIGETEKNLRRLFDAAEDGGAILFFDEADALFGKRSGVKDSHDRYANIEMNYLLQRIEDFNGLVILATNSQETLDPAFLQRFRFIIPLHPVPPGA